MALALASGKDELKAQLMMTWSEALEGLVAASVGVHAAALVPLGKHRGVLVTLAMLMLYARRTMIFLVAPMRSTVGSTRCALMVMAAHATRSARRR